MTDQEIIYKAISEVVNTDKPAEFAAHNSTCYTIAKYVCEDLREKLIKKACEWLNKNVVEYHPRTGKLRPIVNSNAFREAMEKEDEQ